MKGLPANTGKNLLVLPGAADAAYSASVLTVKVVTYQ
jgi:hypothetical protein